VEAAPTGPEAGPSSAAAVATPTPSAASAARPKRRASGDLRTPHLKAKDDTKVMIHLDQKQWLC
jgi:hypothetical protein